MLKHILLLCLALASCHPTSAAWPFSSGERSSSSNAVYADQGALNAENLQNYIQYFANQAAGYAQQQPSQQLSSELNTQQFAAQQTTTNHGTKGTGGLFSRNKSNQQQQSPQNQVFFSSQPENIFNYGHVEVMPTANATDSKAKSNRFRSILPWNWVFGSSSSATSNSDAQQSAQGFGQQAVPKRSWNPFSRQTYVQNQPNQPNQPNQYCQCYPFSIQPSVQTYIPGSDSTPDSNVRLVEPSTDLYNDGSHPIPAVVSAPPQITDVQQQQVQQPQLQNQPQVGPTGTNDQLAAHHQAPSQQQPQMAPQPIQYTVPYQGNTSPYASNENAQSVPASTNYPSLTIETAQNGQVSSSGN